MKAHTPTVNVLAGRHNGGRAGARGVPLSTVCQRIHLRYPLVGRGAMGAFAHRESRTAWIGSDGPILGWDWRRLTAALRPRAPDRELDTTASPDGG